jgi:hypothetical protein
VQQQAGAGALRQQAKAASQQQTTADAEAVLQLARRVCRALRGSQQCAVLDDDLLQLQSSVSQLLGTAAGSL